VQAIGKVRQRVAQSLPAFRWGYNTFVSEDAKHNALDIMLSGGQLSMEESLRHISRDPESFAHYLATLALYRDTVWPHSGNLGVCYDTPQLEGEPLPLDELYLSSFILASGTHPYYSPMEQRYGDFPRFGLRYSQFLWDTTLRPLADPAKVVHFNGPKYCEWQRLARIGDLGGKRRRLILHLINPPVDDLSLHNFAALTPAPVRNQKLDLTLPPDAHIESAYCLNPRKGAEPIKLTPGKEGASTSLTIPEIRLWEMVVIDYSADKSP
jgi:hypothetical protein